MKTQTPTIRLILATAVFGAVASFAHAGPGIDYWLDLGKPRQEPSAKAGPLPGSLVCTGSRTIPVTEFKNLLPNGKGPMNSVQVGTKQVCDVCGATYTAMRSTWPNGKGPLEAVQVKTSHDCNASCAMR